MKKLASKLRISDTEYDSWEREELKNAKEVVAEFEEG